MLLEKILDRIEMVFKSIECVRSSLFDDRSGTQKFLFGDTVVECFVSGLEHQQKAGRVGDRFDFHSF